MTSCSGVQCCATVNAMCISFGVDQLFLDFLPVDDHMYVFLNYVMF